MNRMKRYSDIELENFLKAIESDRVERKRAFKNEAEKARQDVCAFSNDLPNHNEGGLLFFGAEDNGDPSHLPITDAILKNISDMKTDGNILPLPVFTVEKKILLGAEMAVVTVLPSDMPPVRYNGQIWIRTGSRHAIANAQEERILNEKRRFKDVPFDIHPISIARIEDLSKLIFENEYLPAAFAKEVLETNNRTYEERLSSCKTIVSPRDTTPTILGLLTLGKSPQDFIPGSYVQFLRIEGTALFDPVIDEAEIKGSLPDIIRRTEEKLKAHNHTAVDSSQGLQIATVDYPHIAFQQLLYNAMMHRSYEGTNTPVRVYWFNDRVEINSPSGPFGTVTVENFGSPGLTDYRNQNIADMFKTLGFVQGYGVGIQTAQNPMKRNGNQAIEFNTNQSTVMCILRIKK
ncbi:MAG: putative DNA binding domain-containing protein [Treponema sp.]|jgi:ATP-dependent DNA helicase RecG|nr:putative DNA binding domain-containing protein [Treponema sp.]